MFFIFSGLIYIVSIDENIDYTFERLQQSSITKIYYYDFIDRKNRIGTPVELKDEQLFKHKSEWTSIEELPENLINAFIAVEDKRFYKHSGVDWLRTGKAVLNYLFKFDNSSFGGSTITQQLVKNLTGNNDTSIKRKTEEIVRALNLEKKLSKKDILEMYLNVVYLSQNCYGVGVASQVYFDKDVRDLTLLECASLASIVKSPNYYEPYTKFENNNKRAKTVLSLMLEQGMISNEEYESAMTDEIIINNNIEAESNAGIYSWYTEALIDEVTDDLAEKYGISKEAARGYIMRGGLNIYSLVDPKIQEACTKVYDEHTKYFTPQKQGYPQSSCVVLDPHTSDILGIVGGVGQKSANLILNRATKAKRPPGSVIKPLSVYAPAIQEGIITYSTVYDDTPLKLSDGRLWPRNSPDKYRGLVPVSLAVERSINTVSVKVLRDLGIGKSLRYLKEFGINSTNDDKNESSLALGQLTNGESLLNITNAYCAFDNKGQISNPKTYLYVTDTNGNIILENEAKSSYVISEETAFITTKLLTNVVKKGTAKNVFVGDGIETAGKTGTSSNNEDRWFVGYTPYYVCGVWTGFDEPMPITSQINPSCTVFNEIMQKIHIGAKEKSFDMPKTVLMQEFCVDSGDIPTKVCNKDLRGERTDIGYYSIGTEPNNMCQRHTEAIIDKSNGKIISGKLPFWRKRRIALLDYDRIVYEGIKILDEDYLLSSKETE